MNMEQIIIYAAIFRETEEGLFFVEFPDLSGCFSQGETLSEAFCKSQEALAIYWRETGGELPEATDIRTIQKEYPNDIVQLVAVDLKKYIVKSLKPVKKTLTIPEWLNSIAEKHSINYSQILKKGLIAYLQEQDSISEYEKRLLSE